MQQFARAWKHTTQRNLIDLDPWMLLTSEGRIRTRSEGVNQRYGDRSVVCFAERRDTDDVACLVVSSRDENERGRVLIVHDFANAGAEVDASFLDFWEWFKAAVDDMIDTFQHWDDPR
jgi:hypothetical protein